MPAEPLDRVGEVEVDPEAAGADPAALVADVLRGPGRDVAGHQVAERRVDPLQVVVALGLRDLPWVALVLPALRHPDPAVVAQRLAHQGELGLVVPADRDARRVDLGEARVGEVGALAVRPPGGGDVAAHRVGGQEEHVPVAAGGQHHRVGEVGLDLAGHQVPDHHPAGLAVDHDQLEHLVPAVHGHGAGGDLALQGLVRADQQLLAGLAAGVEGPGDLDAAERAVVQQPAVLPGERHALGDALVDDLHADLGQPVDVGLPGPEVAALDGVVEQPVDRVAVVAVVLGRVDAALGRDRVGTARGVLVAEARDLVAGLTEGGRRRRAGQPGADDDHAELAPVRRVDQPGGEPTLLPALLDRAGRRLGVGDVRPGLVVGVGVQGVDQPAGRPPHLAQRTGQAS